MQDLFLFVLVLFTIAASCFLWILLRYLYQIHRFISVTKSRKKIDYFMFCGMIILYEYVPSGIQERLE